MGFLKTLLPIASLLPSCINGTPLNLPATSNLLAPRVTSSHTSSNSSLSRLGLSIPDDPFYFNTDRGWVAKYTTWENPERNYEQVAKVLNHAGVLLNSERGSQDWTASWPGRNFRYNDLAISLCFEIWRVESPDPALTFEGILVAIQGSRSLANKFGMIVKGFSFELHKDHFDGPLVATGYLGTSRDASVGDNGHLLLGASEDSISLFNISRRLI